MKEIERKFVARFVGAIPVWEAMDIAQSYIVVCKKFEWRVRMAHYTCLDNEPADETWYATALKIGNGFIRGEYEIYIPRWAYRLLMLLVPQDTTIYKYRVDSGGWSIDIFEEQFGGLVLAEYEVASAEHPQPPLPHGLELVKDVTEDGRFANKRLSRMSGPVRRSMLNAVAAW